MRARTWALLAFALAAVGTAGLALGPVAIAPAAVWRALWGEDESTATAIVRTLRLPRVALGMVVGAGLGMSGAALQATLRNALAEPYLLGVSGGAAVGAVLSVSMHLAGPATLPIAAFAGAAAAVLLVLLVAGSSGRRGDPRVLVMAGVVVGAFANAAILVLLANAPAETVRGSLWWMMGSLGDATWSGAGWVGAYVAAGAALLLLWGREIDVLALGDDPAAALGVDVERASRRVFLVASLLAAATVAGAGLIGFVGLVVPAIARALGARSSRAVILAAALVGATVLVGADLVARSAMAPAELPLGAVTALVGVPFFLARLRRLT